MSDHTALPWAVMHKDKWFEAGSQQPSSVFHIGDYTVVTDSPSYEFHAEDSADAAFIVKCCNAFPDLVNALEKIDQLCRWNDEDTEFIDSIETTARAALALVKSMGKPNG
jgi:hypothetical protein